MTREVYVVKQTDTNKYLLNSRPVKCNSWNPDEAPVELVRFFPDVTTARKAGSNQIPAIKEGNTYKRKYKIIKVKLSMEEVEEVFEQ